MKIMNAANSRIERLGPLLVVHVSQSEGMWIAECDDIGLVTEAESYNQLTDRVWEIAPELFVENGLSGSADGMQISFFQSHEQSCCMVM